MGRRKNADKILFAEGVDAIFHAGFRLRLFGKREELAAAVAAAGFNGGAIEEGIALNLPCRVTTKPSPDGKYTKTDVRGSVEVDFKTRQKQQVAFLRNFAEQVGTLRTIAEKQLEQKELTAKEAKFLKDIVQKDNSSGHTEYNGWYTKLFWKSTTDSGQPDRKGLLQAIDHYRAALRDDPDHYWSHFQLGRCYLSLGRNAEAVAELGTCVALQKEVPWGYRPWRRPSASLWRRSRTSIRQSGAVSCGNRRVVPARPLRMALS